MTIASLESVHTFFTSSLLHSPSSTGSYAVSPRRLFLALAVSFHPSRKISGIILSILTVVLQPDLQVPGMGLSSRISCALLLTLSAVVLTDARGLADVPTVIGRTLLAVYPKDAGESR